MVGGSQYPNFSFWIFPDSVLRLYLPRRCTGGFTCGCRYDGLAWLWRSRRCGCGRSKWVRGRYWVCEKDWNGSKPGSKTMSGLRRFFLDYRFRKEVADRHPILGRLIAFGLIVLLAGITLVAVGLDSTGIFSALAVLISGLVSVPVALWVDARVAAARSQDENPHR